MSALIDFSNNRANMAYRGETPWHGLGQTIDANDTLDEIKTKAGLDWTINRQAVQFTHNEETKLFTDRMVLSRSDTGLPLSVVSDRYNVVQPSEIVEFYRDLTDSGDFTIDTMGSLDGGKKIWALATDNRAIDIGGDIIRPYLRIATACDSTMATKIGFTSVRIVCNNTLQMSLRKGQSDDISISHATTVNYNKVRTQLKIWSENVDQFAASVDYLANQSINDSEALDYFAQLFVKRDDKGNITNEKTAKKRISQVGALYLNGPGAELESAQSTKWGLLNAVTRYVDHHIPANSTNRDRGRHNRFNSSQFGSGAALKARAAQMVLADGSIESAPATVDAGDVINNLMNNAA